MCKCSASLLSTYFAEHRDLCCGWRTSHLVEQQISLGVIAMTQACCEPVLQSSNEQWGMHFAPSTDAWD